MHMKEKQQRMVHPNAAPSKLMSEMNIENLALFCDLNRNSLQSYTKK